MPAFAFDTHRYVKSLVAAGMPEGQAEIIADKQAELVSEHLATKQDIAEIKRDMKEMETGLKRDIADVKRDLTIRMGGIMVTAVTVVAILIKLL